MHAVVCATAIGSGAMGGVFFAFSAFVMSGLNRLPQAQSIAAMQAINVTAVRPALMTGLFGTALGAVVVGIWAARNLADRPAQWLLAGSAVYLVGVMLVTIVINVPLNDSLATVDAATAASGRWMDYARPWGWANHLRTLSGVAGAALLTVGLLQARRPS